MPERLATITGQVPQPGLARRLPLRRPLPVRRRRLHDARSAAARRTEDGVVRCVKADELAVEGLDWVATEVPAAPRSCRPDR